MTRKYICEACGRNKCIVKTGDEGATDLRCPLDASGFLTRWKEVKQIWECKGCNCVCSCDSSVAPPGCPWDEDGSIFFWKQKEIVERESHYLVKPWKCVGCGEDLCSVSYETKREEGTVKPSGCVHND
jgi:hypothetical protein